MDCSEISVQKGRSNFNALNDRSSIKELGDYAGNKGQMHQ